MRALQYLFIFLSIAGSSIFSPKLLAQESDSSSTISKDVYYVKLKGDTLFTITENLGPFSAEARALSVGERLKILSKNDRIKIDSFIVSYIDGYAVVSYEDQALLYINQEDAAAKGKNLKETASEYLDILKSAYSEILKRRTGIYWVKRIGLTLLAILGLYLILVLLNKTFKWIDKRIISYEKEIKHKRKRILNYLRSKNILLVSKTLRTALIVLILLFYLPLIFNFLPWTEGLVTRIYGYLAIPVRYVLNSLVKFLPNLFYIFVIVVIARFVIRFVNYISKEIEEDRLKIKGFYKDWARPTFNILKIILYAFTLVFLFPYLPGSNSPAFKGVSIFLGVLFSLGSTSAIANMVAGIVITYMRPFVIGDRVKIGDSVGDIVEKNMLVTRLRTVKNEDITIPNATIINTHLWNYSKYAQESGIILHPTVTIGYDVPSEQVINLLLKAVQNTKNLTRDFKPFVLQKSLNDFYVEYELNVYTKQPNKMAFLYSELNKSILNEFNAAGVEILSPHYTAFRDGNSSTIPSDPSPKEPSPASNPVDNIIDKVTGRK